MRKTGAWNELGRILLVLAFLTLLFIIFMPMFSEDSLAKKTINFIRNSAGSITNLNIGVATHTCMHEDNAPQNEQLIRQLAAASSNPPVPPILAVALAKQESDLKHCRGNKVVESGPGQSYNSIGLMQIHPPTGESTCPGLDYYKVEDNAACGIKVLQSKYNAANSGNYANLVRKYCPAAQNPAANAKYLSYTNTWDRALRAYNGYGCGSTADLNFVENVRSKMS
ncbi:transglycosylase SLT domain-containing protein [Nanoarchaeota archaeon]